MANEMLMAAARRGELGNTPEQIMARLIQFYVEQGMAPEAATRAAAQVVNSDLMDMPSRVSIQDRALQAIREREFAREQQEMYRRNPRRLSDEVASAESMPGYDPTGYRFNRPPGKDARNYRDTSYMLPPASQPMTAAEAREARITRPMPMGDLPGWRQPAPSSPAPSRRTDLIFGTAGLSPSAFRQYMEERDAAARAASEPKQVYIPSAVGPPIKDSGEPPPAPQQRSLAEMVARAANPFTDYSRPSGAAAAPRQTPAPTSAPTAPYVRMLPAPMSAADLEGPAERPGFVSEDMSAAFLDGPAAKLSQPARRAVQVARSVMPANPPMPPRPQREPVGAPMQLPSAAPQGSSEGFLSRLFGSQPETLSSRELFERASQTDSPADFFRADRAMREGRAEGGAAMGEATPFPSPAAPPKPSSGGRDAAITKALDIIHQLVLRGR